MCTTLPTAVEATKFATVLIEERLTACVQIFDPVKSVYRWKEKIECAMERPIHMKTTVNKSDALIARIHGLHPYEIPEILIFAADGVGRDYEAWVKKETNITNDRNSDEAEDKEASDKEEEK